MQARTSIRKPDARLKLQHCGVGLALAHESEMDKTKRTAELNDKLRKSMAVGQIAINISTSIQNSPDRGEIIKAIQRFSSFDPSIDVKSDHSLGVVEVKNQKYIFIIRYLDDRYDYDREIGARELAVMKLSEYRSTRTPKRLREIMAADGP